MVNLEKLNSRGSVPPSLPWWRQLIGALQPCAHKFFLIPHSYEDLSRLESDVSTLDVQIEMFFISESEPL